MQGNGCSRFASKRLNESSLVDLVAVGEGWHDRSGWGRKRGSRLRRNLSLAQPRAADVAKGVSGIGVAVAEGP